jgi:hypothetical protein
MQIAPHPLSEYINGAFGGDAIGKLVSLADSRDEMVKEAPAGLFTDTITGSVDVSMAVVIAMLEFADSLDSEATSVEAVMRERCKAFILTVMDAVYGPNSVRITVYNPEVDWNISVWQLFPIEDTPSSRSFALRVPSQSESLIQWLDVKSRLTKHCRNPKRDAQRMNKIASLEDELRGLAIRHAAMIERFIKIQQGEKDPEGAQARREAEARRFQERREKYKKVLIEKHKIDDPMVRTKRDAFLWGGQPHIIATAAAFNNSTVSKATIGERVRRLSRFGFRSEADDQEIEESSDSSSGADQADHNDLEHQPGTHPQKVGCFAMFKCCGAARAKHKNSK